MRLLALLPLLAALAACYAAVHHPVTAPEGWKLVDHSPESSFEVSVSFALKQRNLKALEKTLSLVSNPASPSFGKHLSLDNLRNLIGASDADIELVCSALRGAGFHAIEVAPIGDYIKAKHTIGGLERFLSTDIGAYSFKGSEQTVLRAYTPYTIPEDIHHIVDFVPGLHGYPFRRLSIARSSGEDEAAFMVTPDVLIKQYDVTEATAAVSNSSQALVEFDFNWFSPDDLQTFFKANAPSQAGRTVSEIFGNNRPDLHTGVEANLDVQYAMGMGYYVNTTVYDNPFNPSIFDSFLDYTQLANSQAQPPLVHSISFGDYGGNYPNSTVQRINTEFQKMGVRGITVLLASGDNGVGCNFPKCTSQEFDFPSSPWITMVGGTTVGQNGGETGATLSSGGFSQDYWQASWQADAIAAYFASGVKLPDPSFYFAEGRGYPDVAAAAENVEIVVNGRTTSVAGTSCAAPIWAGIVSLLNNERLAAGKGPIGFLNQILYSNPQALNDITSGSNPYLCCPVRVFILFLVLLRLS
eukprot:TRINITY_DN1310_c1_g1_i2.p1 TRINITY_DN1310_c1_g1~~TRINITY_DN1310_c1_g1_i2.p1  ORF type:complete len:536 (-),score=164.14 TRINITY_DN1310_c1_g1_i2:58-1635(-)